MLGVYRSGNITLANAIGTGVADDKSIYPYVPKMIEFYLGEKPILNNVPTYLCRDAKDLSYVLAHLNELVVKEVHGAGGYGMLVGPAATQGRDRGLPRAAAGQPQQLHRPADAEPVAPARPSSKPASRRGTSTCGPSCCRAARCRWCPAG